MNNEKESFLKRKNVIISFKRYGIDAMGSMALGLFASLLIGTIINTIGQNICPGSFVSEKLLEIGGYATSVTGAAMALAIGYALQAPPLVMYSLCAVGAACNAIGGSGGPLAVFFVAVLTCEIGKLVSKETKIDIIVTPAVTVIVGVVLAMLLAPVCKNICNALGAFIGWATDLRPFWMGMIISVVVGIVLTLPISSAALGIILGLTGPAAGPATIGCCCQMVGFAVASFRENGVGGLISQGLGTSMLQMGNIVKNPRIWIAPTLASAITGPLATCVFHMEMNGAAVSSGMGTCGLVGQIGVYTGWVSDIAAGTKAAITPMDWAALVLICFVLPAVLSVLFCETERKLGWIKDGDLKLN